jgi:membrane-bound lytic murein transglycosylase C
MQLIPRHAARDSWLYLHPGEDRVIEPAYLLDPRNNIELGAAYLFLLSNRYMSDVADPVKREYAVIAGYNWGPPMVRKNFVESHPVNTMPPQQAYERLKMVSPDETRDYLDRVTTRKKIYAPMFTTK